MEFWPHWLRPAWLLLAPLLGWLLWQLWHRERRAGRWQQILPSAFHSLLLTRSNGRGNRLPWIALGLAWLLALLALLGPSWQQLEQTVDKPADPLVIMIDLTPQMLASDTPPNRLEQARRKILDLLEARRDAQTAVVVYAGSAHVLVPLSDDMATTHNLLDALKPSIMPEPGQRADLAVAKALDLLRQGARDQGRLLLITGDLSDAERSAIARQLGRQGERLRLLGMGTPQGAPILQEGGGYLLDDQGAIKLSRLDSASLNRFADEIGARYASWRLDDGDLRTLDLLDAPQHLREEGGERVRLAHWVDQGHWLLLPLLLLAACAGRRGWLFCLPLLLVLPQPGYAWSFDDLWLRADQQGQRLLDAQRPAEAAQRFTDPLRQGHALYQAGDYPAAAQRFAEGDSAADHYNRGNALAQAGELQAALEAYDQALVLQPELPQALHNRTLIENLLREREEEQQHDDSPSSSSTPQPSPAGTASQKSPERDADNNPEGESLETDGASTTPARGTASESDSEQPAHATAQPADALGDERRQALEQWLRQIPDDPAELLRRKFWYEQQTRDPQQ
jgi:Ca-activated chloride channel family protein